MKIDACEKHRCPWPSNDPLMIAYHDTEWGVPLFDDCKLFEFLVLEGVQAGLSWRTVLHKRENYRRAFDAFDPEKIARYDAKKIEALLQNAGIIRNRQKIAATIQNARCFLQLVDERGSFSDYQWHFVAGKTRHNGWKELSQLPATSKESDALSKDLKSRGFKFVGSTIIYAHMQAVGMINDHLTSCFRHHEIKNGDRRGENRSPERCR